VKKAAAKRSRAKLVQTAVPPPEILVRAEDDPMRPGDVVMLPDGGTAAVEKIVGPGNLFVMLAKRAVFGHVDVDMLAGPSEVLVLADATARAEWIAADLLAQAEHDPLASCVLVTDSAPLARAVQRELGRQLASLPRAEIAAAALRDWGVALVTRDLDEAVALANTLAPEHLEVHARDPGRLAKELTCAEIGRAHV
jgi:histidinol dehydrogenase